MGQRLSISMHVQSPDNAKKHTEFVGLTDPRGQTIIRDMIDTKSLKHAIVLQEKIDALQAELNAILGSGFAAYGPATKRRGRPPGIATGLLGDAVAPKPRKKRRKLSPEALEKIREGQRRRWAKVHKEQKKAAK